MPLPRSHIGRRSKDRETRLLRTSLNLQKAAKGTTTDHGLLLGLGDDDHPQYPHLSSDENILGQWTFDPSSTQAPFLIGTNAIDQTVTGLTAENAIDSDKVDGLHAATQPGASAAVLATTSAGVAQIKHLRIIDTSADGGLWVSYDGSHFTKLITAIDDDFIITTLNNGSVRLNPGGTGYIHNAKTILGSLSEFSADTTVRLHLRDTTAPQMRIDYDATYYASLGVNGAGDLTIDAIGDLNIPVDGSIFLDPAGDQVNPVNNYDINLGQINKKYLSLHAAELVVETLVAQDTIATIGGRILVGPTTVLTSDIGTGDTTIYVKHNQMQDEDRVYLEADGKVEFVQINSGPSGSGPYSYTVVRNLDGTGANVWYAGDAVFNTGTTGNGWIDLYSFSGMASGTTGPTIVGNIRLGSTYNNWTEGWAIGNLKGLYGQGASDKYGVGLGRYADTYDHLLITDDGIEIWDGDEATGTKTASWVGNTITLGSNPKTIINSTNVNMYDASGIRMLRLAAGTIQVGQYDNGDYINIDSNSINFYIGSTQRGYITATSWRFGLSNGERIEWDTTNGLRIFNGQATPEAVIKLPTSGDAQIVGTLNVTSPGEILAGSGTVKLDADGITIEEGMFDARRIIWHSTTFSEDVAWIEAERANTNQLRLFADNDSFGSGSHVIAQAISATAAGNKVTGMQATQYYDQTASLTFIVGNNSKLFLDTTYAKFYDKLFINESSNAKMTYGLTIMGYDATEMISLKNTQVIHGMTTPTETDTFGSLKIVADNVGGLLIEGYTEGSVGAILYGRAISPNSTTSTTGRAVTEIQSGKKSGAGTIALVSSENVFAVRNLGTTELIVKYDGRLFVNGNYTGGSPAGVGLFDEYDDIKLLAGVRGLSRESLRDRFSEFIDYARPVLEATETVILNDGQYGNDDDGSMFMSVQGMFHLHNDAIRQMHLNFTSQINQLKRALLDEGISIPQLEA